MNPEKLAFNVNEACHAIGVGRTKIYELINSGRLRSFRLDGRTLIRADVLREFIEVTSERAA